ncbi:hypothetical protein EXIGLDRAFT_764274 [Exidia glandulosa HHB12029]|uniref:Uncharacterized protein n=1 Tax=Exidia glandulosa HHB12029 TaxID=1314781 RepID=A0A165LB11_EXIGL|nr:hypothetical protein EXIGLDRAFT_764274 [Exidia glandulosa HHB12029]
MSFRPPSQYAPHVYPSSKLHAHRGIDSISEDPRAKREQKDREMDILVVPDTARPEHGATRPSHAIVRRSHAPAPYERKSSPRGDSTGEIAGAIENKTSRRRKSEQRTKKEHVARLANAQESQLPASPHREALEQHGPTSERDDDDDLRPKGAHSLPRPESKPVLAPDDTFAPSTSAIGDVVVPPPQEHGVDAGTGSSALDPTTIAELVLSPEPSEQDILPTEHLPPAGEPEPAVETPVTESATRPTAQPDKTAQDDATAPDAAPTQATSGAVTQPVTPFRPSKTRRFEGTPRDESYAKERRDRARNDFRATVEDADDSDDDDAQRLQRYPRATQHILEDAVEETARESTSRQDEHLSVAYQEQLHEGWNPEIAPNTPRAAAYIRAQLQRASPPDASPEATDDPRVQRLERLDTMHVDGTAGHVSPTVSVQASIRARRAPAGVRGANLAPQPRGQATRAHAPETPRGAAGGGTNGPARPTTAASLFSPAAARPPSAMSIASSRLDPDPQRARHTIHVAAERHPAAKAKTTEEPIPPCNPRPIPLADAALMQQINPDYEGARVQILVAPDGIPYTLDGMQRSSLLHNISEVSAFNFASETRPKRYILIQGDTQSIPALAATTLEILNYWDALFGASIPDWRNGLLLAYAIPANPDAPRFNLLVVAHENERVIDAIAPGLAIKIDDLVYFAISEDVRRSGWLGTWGNTTILSNDDAHDAYTHNMLTDRRVLSTIDRVAPFFPPEAQHSPVDYTVASVMVDGYMVKVRLGRGLEVPVYNVHCGAISELPEQEAKILRRALAKVKVVTAWHGLGTRLKAYRCDFCYGRSHPRGLCPFERLPGWSRGHTAEEAVQHEDADDDDDNDDDFESAPTAVMPPTTRNQRAGPSGRGARGGANQLAPARGRGSFRARNRV